MTEKTQQSGSINKALRWIFGVRVRSIEIEDIRILQEEDAIPIMVSLPIPQNQQAFYPLPKIGLYPVNNWPLVLDLFPGPNSWELITPGVARTHYNVLIDVPGRYQFPGNILLKKTQLVQLGMLDKTPASVDLTSMFVQGWQNPQTKNAIYLLTGQEEPYVESPEINQLPDNELWVSKPDQLEQTFKLQGDYLDLSEITLKTWQPIEVENLSLSLNRDQEFYEQPIETLLFSGPEYFSPEFNLVLDQEWIEVLNLTWPDVISEDMLDIIKGRGQAGKSYDEEAKSVDEFQEPITEQQLELCIHGIPKATCAICKTQVQKATTRTKTGRRKPRVVNPFDLLLPFLYPPLGSNFDNVLTLPPDKKLYGFQVEGARFLITKERALLGDEMGLGKSIQAIFAMRVVFRSTSKPISAAIICPKSVLRDWEKKIEEWSPELRVIVVTGPKKLREHLWETPNHIYLVSYDTLVRDYEFISENGFDLVILDEVQNIKNSKPKRTRVVKKIDARWRWGLSATPLENKVEDVVNIFSYLKPGLLSRNDTHRVQLVKSKIEPYFKRRRVHDVQGEIGLGEKISNAVWLELTDEQTLAYNAAFGKVRDTLKPEARKFTSLQRTSQNIQIEVRGKVLAQISQLKLICNFDPKTKKSIKTDFLEEKLKEIQNTGDKALVFSQYPNLCFEDLTPRLLHFKPDRFDGSLSDKERARRIEMFQTSDTNTVLLMSLKAGGVGITLTRANHVFLYDHWWNPAVASQAIGRAYRIGQEKPVFVTSLYTVGTIEEKIYRLLENKKELFRLVIDDLSEESGLGGVDVSLTTEELLELFDLVTFDVDLKKPGREIGKTIQIVMELTNKEFKQARHIVEDYPATILKNLPRIKADQAANRLKTTGAQVELRSRPAD